MGGSWERVSEVSVFSLIEAKSRLSCVLGRCSTTEVYPQPSFYFNFDIGSHRIV